MQGKISHVNSGYFRYNNSMRAPKSLSLLLLLSLTFLAGCLPAQPVQPTEPALIPATPAPQLQTDLPTGSPGQPTPTPAPTALIDSLWFINQPEQVIVKVDPASNTIIGRVGLSGMLGPVAAGEGAVWVAQSIEGSPTMLLKIDPDSYAVLASTPIEYGRVTSITTALGVVWLGIAEPFDESTRLPGDYRQPGGLLMVDPLTGGVRQYMPRDGAPIHLAFYLDQIWMLDSYDVTTHFSRLNPNGIEWNDIPPASVYQFSRFAINSTGIWAVSADTRSRFIYQVDPVSGMLLSVLPVSESPEDNPVDIAAGDDAIWVICRSGRVLRLDTSGQPQAEISIKPGPSDLSFHFDSLWIENFADSELYRLNPESLGIELDVITGRKPIPTPTLAPRTIEPTPSCDAPYSSRLVVGMLASVSVDPPVPNRVRVSAEPEAEILGEIDPGEIVSIIDGPVCANGWIWWKISSTTQPIEGWTSEGDAKGYWLVPEQ